MARITDTPNTLTSPVWAADFIAPKDLMPGGAKLDVTQFFAQDSVLVTAGATANIGATAITVSALSGAIPAGTVLDFGGAGAKPAKVTVAAAAGATSLTVAALLAQVVVGNTARYAGDGTKTKVIQSGVIIGRTVAERLANTAFGPAAWDDDEIFIVPFERSDLAKDNDIELLRQGFAVYENRLPQWTQLNTAMDEVQTVSILGTLTAGQFKMSAIVNGVLKYSEDIAYNANTAAIQTGYDTVFGAGLVVVGGTGTVASHTATFSGAGFTGIPQELIQLDTNELTGITSASVTRTTKGGTPLLTKLRALFRMTTGVN